MASSATGDFKPSPRLLSQSTFTQQNAQDIGETERQKSPAHPRCNVDLEIEFSQAQMGLEALLDLHPFSVEVYYQVRL